MTATVSSRRYDDNPPLVALLDLFALVDSLEPMVTQEGTWDWYLLDPKPWVEYCGEWTWYELSSELVLTVRSAARCGQWHCSRCGWESFARDYLRDAATPFTSVEWVYVVRLDSGVGWEAAYTKIKRLGGHYLTVSCRDGGLWIFSDVDPSGRKHPPALAMASRPEAAIRFLALAVYLPNVRGRRTVSWEWGPRPSQAFTFPRMSDGGGALAPAGLKFGGVGNKRTVLREAARRIERDRGQVWDIQGRGQLLPPDGMTKAEVLAYVETVIKERKANVGDSPTAPPVPLRAISDNGSSPGRSILAPRRGEVRPDEQKATDVLAAIEKSVGAELEG